MGDIVPRKTLVKYGSQGVAGLAGGAALLALNGLGPVGSLIVGGIVAIVGLALSRSKEDKTAGYIALGAGALTAVTAIGFLRGIAGTLLGISGIGLLVMGGINVFRFIRGYRNRA